MKIFRNLFLIILVVSCSSTEKIPTERIYLDEEGHLMTRIDFNEKWRNKENGLARWDHVENGKRIISLSSPLFKRYSLDYFPLLRNLERITGQQFAENSILVMHYNYKDDLCSSRSSNNWHKIKIRERKSSIKPIRKTVLTASENVVYLDLFEEGIKLKNKPDASDEFFFQDKKNFFRETIFKDPTLCGSYVLAKPNGQALVRNGEWRADHLVILLQP